MTFPIEVRGLDVHFADVRAVDDVSFTVPGGTICGLLGRNGAGKSTLLSVLAAYRRPTRGTVLVDGEDPWENARVMSETCLIRAGGDLEPTLKVSEVLAIAGDLRPRWDPAFAERLVDRFKLPLKAKVSTLSRGNNSALGVSVGLATRAPLTVFDEPHLGMDAPSRYAFYDELLADYLVSPRTLVLSTHLIDEVANLLEQVVILHEGRILADEPSDRLRSRGAEVTGPAEAVAALTAGRRVLSARELGRTRSAVVFEPLDDERMGRARALGVDIGPLPLQDLFVHLTNQAGTTAPTSQEASR